MFALQPVEHSAQLELLRAATQGLGRSSLILVVAVGVLAAAAWQADAKLNAAVVACLAVIVGAWRVRIARRVSNSSACDAAFVGHAVREIEANITLTAAMWVVSTVSIYPALDLSGRSFYAAVMCGSIGAAAFFLPLVGRSFVILTVAQMTALVGMSVLDAQTRSIPVACLAILYAITMLAGGRRFSAVMAGSIHNRLQVDAVNESLVRVKDAAESASRAKSAFLANMSHEIRTPLTAVIGFAEELLDLDRTMKQRIEATQTIHRAGKHLLHVVNDILDLSKIEAGQVDLERTTVPLLTLIDEVSALARLQSTEKGLIYQLESVFPLPATVHTDPLRLRQILLNLVTNAVKFTGAGQVTLGCRYDTTTEQLVLLVSDTGVGITEAQQERLFQPFGQADASISRRFGGTGLGLVLSRNFAELLGGTLKLERSSAAGSCFVVTLPVAPVGELLACEPVAPPLLPELIHAAHDGGMALVGKILLAEDNADNQRLIGRRLQRMGATVEIVSNGSEAIAAALADPRHLILMDMQMPVMDGPGATRVLRAQGYRGVIVALTANATREDMQVCSDAGCDGFLTKPIDLAQFERTIRSFLPNAPPGIGTSLAEGPLFAEVDVDAPTRAQALDRLLAGLPPICDRMRTAFRGADVAQISELARDLNGLARAVQCPPAAQLGGQLEFAATAGNLSAVAHLLARFDKLIARCREEAKPASKLENVEPKADAAIVSELLAEEPDMIELVSYFIDRLPGYQSAMKDAAAAHDFGRIGTCAHDLKAVGGGYGYPSLLALATAFEAAVAVENEPAVLRLVEDFDALARRIHLGAGQTIGPAAHAVTV